MGTRIRLRGTKIQFPQGCVVCGQPADCDYPLERTLSYGSRSVTIQLPVPMCAAHYDLAVQPDPLERAIEHAGLATGALLGVVVTVSLILYWESSGQGGWLNDLIALVPGAGIFLAVWMGAKYGLAPYFGAPLARSARRAVQIRRYFPITQELELEFINERVAQAVQRANSTE